MESEEQIVKLLENSVGLACRISRWLNVPIENELCREDIGSQLFNEVVVAVQRSTETAYKLGYRDAVNGKANIYE